MTMIAMKESADRVSIASDRQVTTGWQSDQGWINKVVDNGPITFAVAGYVRALQVLQFAKLPPTPAGPTADLVDRFLQTELVPAIQGAFAPLDSEARDGSVMLVVLGGRVYRVASNGSWTRTSNGLYAIGSGSEYALGAMSAGATPAEAVKIAAEYDVGTGWQILVREIVRSEAPR